MAGREVRGSVNYNIPFVHAPPGVGQNAINFTSHTFNQIISGLNSAANDYARSGNFADLRSRLGSLAHRVPYGRADLLPVWLDTLAGFGIGVGVWPLNRVPNGTGGAALRQVKRDLINYLDDGVGVRFNVLLSGQDGPSDGHLIYNGKVGHSPPAGQPIVRGGAMA